MHTSDRLVYLFLLFLFLYFILFYFVLLSSLFHLFVLDVHMPVTLPPSSYLGNGSIISPRSMWHATTVGLWLDCGFTRASLQLRGLR